MVMPNLKARVTPSMCPTCAQSTAQERGGDWDDVGMEGRRPGPKKKAKKA
jgi:hypothetical protein